MSDSIVLAMLFVVLVAEIRSTAASYHPKFGIIVDQSLPLYPPAFLIATAVPPALESFHMRSGHAKLRKHKTGSALRQLQPNPSRFAIRLAQVAKKNGILQPSLADH